jgi:hypothetical protein
MKSKAAVFYATPEWQAHPFLVTYVRHVTEWNMIFYTQQKKCSDPTHSVTFLTIGNNVLLIKINLISRSHVYSRLCSLFTTF